MSTLLVTMQVCLTKFSHHQSAILFYWKALNYRKNLGYFLHFLTSFIVAFLKKKASLEIEIRKLINFPLIWRTLEELQSKSLRTYLIKTSKLLKNNLRMRNRLCFIEYLISIIIIGRSIIVQQVKYLWCHKRYSNWFSTSKR